MTTYEIALAAITASIALYGAILSTYNLVAERRKVTSCLLVKGSLGNHHPEGMELVEPQLFLNAPNEGQCPVTVANCGLRIHGSDDLFLGHHNRDVKLPVELSPGKSCTISLPATAIGSYAKEKGLLGTLEIRAFFQDSLGNRYSSRPQGVDVSPYFPKS